MSDEPRQPPTGPRRWMDRELAEIVRDAVRRMEALEEKQAIHEHVIFGVREHPETGLLARFLAFELRLSGIDTKLNRIFGGVLVVAAIVPLANVYIS